MSSKIMSVIGILSFVILTSSTTSAGTSSYDIAGIYEKVDLQIGSKVLDSYGNIKEARALYVPTKIDIGKYEVELTRIDSNLYQICGTSLYIETRYCYEYATRDDAILVVTSNYGYTRGEVVFLE